MEGNVKVGSGLSPGAIREMEAGRVMDEEVAIRVMGWIPEPIEGSEEIRWMAQREGFAAPQRPSTVSGNAGGVGGFLWRPSEGIEDAWRVLEKLEDEGVLFQVGNSVKRWEVCFSTSEQLGRGRYQYVRGDTAPLAICRAALLWVVDAR